MLKASLGSVEFIASLCKSEDESRKIKEAVNASSYGRDFVHAALSVEEKVRLHLLGWVGISWKIPSNLLLPQLQISKDFVTVDEISVPNARNICQHLVINWY